MPALSDEPPDEETRQFAEYVDFHRANPNVSLVQYRRKKVAELERALAGRKIIYLDTKYWIYLRDPDASPNRETNWEIRRLLYAGVSSGKLICPMSFAIYMELQALPLDRRLATARIMDDLSLGYCLSAPDHVYGIEISRFFIENVSTFRRFAYAIVPVWTRVGALFGVPTAPTCALPLDYETAMNKSLLDRLWNLTVSQMATLRDRPMAVESAADEINMERSRYPRNGQSFHELYCNELLGLLDFNKPIIDSSVRDVAALVLEPGDMPASAFSEQFPSHFFVNVLRHATTLRRGQLGLAMQRTEAALYAILRLDEQRPFKPNDANDIRHTAAALAYCDVYLTERFFATLTNRREIRNVAPIHCQVAWIPEDALNLIRAMS